MLLPTGDWMLDSGCWSLGAPVVFPTASGRFGFSQNKDEKTPENSCAADPEIGQKDQRT